MPTQTVATIPISTMVAIETLPFIIAVIIPLLIAYYIADRLSKRIR